MNDYIYSFSVPLFFIISGYLTKGYDNNKTLFIKLYHNLFLPYILICLLNLLLSPIIVHFNIHQFFLELIRIVAGGEETTGPIWYVYSLMVIRIVYQFLYKRRCLLYTMALFCILLSMYLNYNNLHLPWAVIANVIGFPLFMLGNRCRSFDVSLWVNSIYIKKYWMLLLVLLLSIINYTLSGINGPAYLYINEYGNNIILFYLLAILGTISVFIISVLLSKHSPQWMHTTSMGTILILGFHLQTDKAFSSSLS
jgi:acyltransferase